MDQGKQIKHEEREMEEEKNEKWNCKKITYLNLKILLTIFDTIGIINMKERECKWRQMKSLLKHG